MTQNKKHKIVLVDDHTLVRKGFVELINKFNDYTVDWEASDGKEFIYKLMEGPIPEIVVLDISMPVMDGYETADFLRKNYPEIKILIISMFDKEDSIFRMLEIGVDGYILKDATPEELKIALDKLIDKGFYYSEFVTGTMAHTIRSNNIYTNKIKLCEREIQFLEFAGTNLTYQDIAEKMDLSVRTVEGYRDDLFSKLNIKTRQELAVYSIQKGYYRGRYI